MSNSYFKLWNLKFLSYSLKYLHKNTYIKLFNVFFFLQNTSNFPMHIQFNLIFAFYNMYYSMYINIITRVIIESVRSSILQSGALLAHSKLSVCVYMHADYLLNSYINLYRYAMFM